MECESLSEIELLMSRFDYYNQFCAIRALLGRHHQADEDLSDEIRKTEKLAATKAGASSHRVDDHWADLMHTASFQDAAHSMAAVGMLAPTIESFFKHTFRAMGEPFQQRKREGFPLAVMRVSQKVGMDQYLPADLKTTLQALWKYRNAMFHNGFEWPAQEAENFRNRLTDCPPDWFLVATSDGSPWMFYMSRGFVSHCVRALEMVFVGVEYFIVDRERARCGMPPIDRKEWEGFDGFPLLSQANELP